MRLPSTDIVVTVGANGIAVVTLNRPAKRNAVSLAMWRDLESVYKDLASRDVRVVILTGAGGNFCAGADISEFPTVRADAEAGRIYEAAAEAATSPYATSRAQPSRPSPVMESAAGAGSH